MVGTGNMSKPMGTTCERRMGTYVNQCEPHVKWDYFLTDESR